MIDDDAAGDIDHIRAHERPRSNRGFWIIATATAMVCVVMVVAIFVNRPLKDTIARTESDLKAALARAQRIRSSSGTFAGADATTLAAADDTRTYVGSDEGSGGPGIVSVYASADVWAAAVQARPGACFFIKQAIGQEVRYAVAEGDCTGRAALAAGDDRW